MAHCTISGICDAAAENRKSRMTRDPLSTLDRTIARVGCANRRPGAVDAALVWRIATAAPSDLDLYPGYTSSSGCVPIRMSQYRDRIARSGLTTQIKLEACSRVRSSAAESRAF